MAKSKRAGELTEERCSANASKDPTKYEACGKKMCRDLEDEYGYICPSHGEMK
jgi:hypothetical protein